MTNSANIITGQFPQTRMRRNRSHSWIRELVSEYHLTASDLIYPLFVQKSKDPRTAIASMPGIDRLNIEEAVIVAQQAESLNIPAIALFPVTSPELKSDQAEEAYNENNLICRTIKAIKENTNNLGIIADVALDPYTLHGHDGILVNDEIDNDITIEILKKQSITLAKAGCDIIAPSDMMDGRVGQIRDALDQADFSSIKILSYAAKYASSFYGPFRDAVGSAQNIGTADKKTYQMSPHNADESLREVALDIQEGADMIMVKPGMPYLDIISRIKSNFYIPVFAYQVSGEYAMLKAASSNGWLDEESTILESLIAFKRAGVSGIFTYAALDVAKILQGQ